MRAVRGDVYVRYGMVWYAMSCFDLRREEGSGGRYGSKVDFNLESGEGVRFDSAERLQAV
jgi:hypothetical protein